MGKVAWRAVVILLAAASFSAGAPVARAPAGTVIWAWERPEDLRSIAPGAAVAFLAQTLELRGSTTSVLPRRQPLTVDPATPLIAVTRIETRSAALTAAQREQAAAAIARTAALPRVTAVQIDFDAVVSERVFYRDLLADLRRRLPRTPISITALASWCYGDDWIATLPVDEAVPMLFRMGVDERDIRIRLAAGEDFRDPLCRTSYGVSLDEPRPPLRPGRRLYVFSPRPWARSSLQLLSGADR